MDHRYNSWMLLNEPGKQELAAQRVRKFENAPKISVVVPVYNPRAAFLKEMIKSVLGQTYSNWELCLADGGSTDEEMRQIMKRHAAADDRLKLLFLKKNLGIAGNTNAALGLAGGDFVALLDHDDLLAPSAFFEVVKLINEKPSADFIYSDQDSIDEDGKERFAPFFKPDWSPDLLRAHNFISHLAVIRKGLLERTGGFREGFDGSQDHDLFLRLSEETAYIEHIPKVLYHWRVHANSTALNTATKSYAMPAGVRAIKEHLERTGLSGDVEVVRPAGFYRVNYALQSCPKVSIIIPNKDSIGILRKCLDSILEKTTYANYEIIVVENNSVEEDTFSFYGEISKNKRIKILKYEGIFNYSRINNFAASKAEGEILLLLNNDTEVIAPDWVERMLAFAVRPDVGAVGALLLYPDKLIQHAGVVTGFRGAGCHYHTYSMYGEDGYFGSLVVARNVNAVTAACLMVRRDVYFEVDGLDENFQVAWGDVDFCLKIRNRNYLIIFTPDAVLYHHESKTRGYEDTPEKVKRFVGEIELLQSKWKENFEKGDPYYSPNFSMTEGVFVINAPGRFDVLDKMINKALSINPKFAKFYLRERSKLRSPYRIYLRPRLIKIIDTIFWKPETRLKIRFYYRKIFY